jgi:hypothetical protein
VCKDCRAEAEASGGQPFRVRPAPHAGPRCTTHHNAFRRDRRLASKIRHVEKTYGITDEQYNALYKFQGGRCALCQRATGATKRLAVDHDHQQAMIDGHHPDKGCDRCIRGLVCSICNDILAHFRSEPSAGLRITAYLTRSPWKTLREVGHGINGYPSWADALEGRARGSYRV